MFSHQIRLGILIALDAAFLVILLHISGEELGKNFQALLNSENFATDPSMVR
jgi:hypothetical protein